MQTQRDECNSINSTTASSHKWWTFLHFRSFFAHPLICFCRLRSEIINLAFISVYAELILLTALMMRRALWENLIYVKTYKIPMTAKLNSKLIPILPDTFSYCAHTGLTSVNLTVTSRNQNLIELIFYKICVLWNATKIQDNPDYLVFG